ncbi:MAG TPA: sugar-binding protein [Blastocatellia bacterium]|nr:sugar-binding protein [Blastocatellia bacterium]
MGIDRRIGCAAFVCSAMVTMALMSSGCSRSGQKKSHIAFVTNNSADFWTIARRGTEQAAAELPDVNVEFRIPSDGTAAEQRRIVDDLMAKGLEGIAISPVDPANQTAMLDDVAKQAVLITQDSDAPQSNRLCYIGTDNRAAGHQAGDVIKQVLPDGGKIMIFVGKSDVQNARERLDGIKDAIAGAKPKIDIVDVRTDDADPVRAKSNAADTLVKYPDISCLVGLWSYNGPAILNATKDAGRVGKVKIVCFDEDDQTLAGIKDGAIAATVVQQPYEFGYRAIRLIEKVLQGDKSDVPGSKQIFVPTKVIDKDSVDEFAERINKLRGRN